MNDIRQMFCLRIPTRLLKIVKIIATSDDVSVNEEIIRLMELGIKSYMNKSVENEDLVLREE